MLQGILRYVHQMAPNALEHYMVKAAAHIFTSTPPLKQISPRFTLQ